MLKLRVFLNIVRLAQRVACRRVSNLLAAPCEPNVLAYIWLTSATVLYAARSQVFDLLARPERFELPTSWFVARHSIQLSYGRAARNFWTDGRSKGGLPRRGVAILPQQGLPFPRVDGRVAGSLTAGLFPTEFDGNRPRPIPLLAALAIESPPVRPSSTRKLETVLPGLVHELAQLTRRQRADGGQRIDAQPKQHR